MRVWSRPARVIWLLLLLVAVVPVVSAAADLAALAAGRLPGDHETAFAQMTGQPWSSLTTANPALSQYIGRLEAGYAIHELTFGIMLALIVGFWLRPHRPAAWAACWPVVLADVGYLLTFAVSDPALKARGVVDVVVTVALLLLIARPAISGTRHPVSGEKDARGPA